MESTPRPRHEVVYELQQKMDLCQQMLEKFGRNHLMFIKALESLLDNCMSIDRDFHKVVCYANLFIKTKNKDNNYLEKKGLYVIMRTNTNEYTRKMGIQVEGIKDNVFDIELMSASYHFSKNGLDICWTENEEEYKANITWSVYDEIQFNDPNNK